MLRSELERLQPPPREVPFLVYIQALFGGLVPQIAWLMLLILLVVSWNNIIKTDWQSILFELGPLKYQYGTIYDIKPTGLREYFTQTKPSPLIYAHYYEFNIDGKKYNGVSYSINKNISNGTIQIEYLPWDSTMSRIKGERSTPLAFNFGTFFFCILLLFSLRFIFRGLSLGYNSIHLFKKGVIGKSLYESSQIIGGVSLRGGPRIDFWEVIMKYIGPMGKIYRTKVVTDSPQVLQDDPVELALCDPANPRRFVPIDAIPGGLVIDEFGVIKHAGIPHILMVSILPLSTILFLVYHILFG